MSKSGVDVSTVIMIACPVQDVASFAADPANAPRWYVNIKSVEWKSSPPLRIGSRVAFIAQFLGKKLEYTYEVTDYQPGKLMLMRTAQGPFPMETTYQWEAIGPNQTRMTLRNRGKPSGFGSLMAPFMALAMRKANQKDLAKLKALLEENDA